MSLRDDIISRENDNAVKKLYQTLKLENLAEMNELYNFQDTTDLCKIFESRTTYLQKMLKFNPRKCNSATSFSGCVHRDKSKCLIAFRTDSEQLKLFERILIGGFSCVNTRLAFDCQILMPKTERDNLTIIYDIKTINNNKNILKI